MRVTRNRYGGVSMRGVIPGALLNAGLPPLVANWSGPSMVMDAGTWTTDIVSPFSFVAPSVNGNVYVVTPDGGGGVYLGGVFTEITDDMATYARDRIAHLDAFGRVTSWNPGSDQNVFDIKVIDDDYVAVGKAYSSTLANNTLGGFDCRGFGVVHRSTGVAMSWDPALSNAVCSLLVDGDWLWRGVVSGSSGQSVRRYSISTQVLSSWSYSGGPSFPTSIDVVPAGVLVSGRNVNADGTFDMRNYVNDSDVVAYAPTPTMSSVTGPAGHHVTGDGDLFLFSGGLTHLSGNAVRGAGQVDVANGSFIGLAPGDGAPVSGGVLRMGSSDAHVLYQYPTKILVVDRATGDTVASLSSTGAITPFFDAEELAGRPLVHMGDEHFIIYGDAPNLTVDSGATILSGTSKLYVVRID